MDLIVDRTLKDIQNAKEIRAKIQKGESPTEEELIKLERGSLTINTINRIEKKQTELKKKLNSMGYWNNSTSNKNWDFLDFFLKSDLERFIGNEYNLKESFFVYSQTATEIFPLYDYKQLNAIEKILYDIEQIVKEIEINYRKSGTFKSGEEK